MSEDYLKRFEADLKKAEKAREHESRAEYKRVHRIRRYDYTHSVDSSFDRDLDKIINGDFIIDSDSTTNNDSYDEEKKADREMKSAVATAHISMKYAIKHRDLDLALKATKAYEALGLADRPSVKGRLLLAVEKIIKESPHDKGYEDVLSHKEEIESFLRSHGKKHIALEGRVATLAIMTGFILFLSFLSASATGYAVAPSVFATSSTIIGILLLVILLISLFFAIRTHKTKTIHVK